MESNKKIYVNLRLKSTPSFADDGDFVERPGPSCNLHYVCVVLCCSVEAVQNDQEKKEIGDGRKYNRKEYPSFQAQINK